MIFSKKLDKKKYPNAFCGASISPILLRKHRPTAFRTADAKGQNKTANPIQQYVTRILFHNQV